MLLRFLVDAKSVSVSIFSGITFLARIAVAFAMLIGVTRCLC